MNQVKRNELIKNINGGTSEYILGLCSPCSREVVLFRRLFCTKCVCWSTFSLSFVSFIGGFIVPKASIAFCTALVAVIGGECFIEITPDFLCPFMND